MTLHPGARDFLFKHYRTLRRVFGDVLGLLEIDYLAMTLITPQNELLFLSSQPAIECNLIENNLWQTDPCYSEAFFEKNTFQFWEDIYHKVVNKQLLHYRQTVYEFNQGLSLPDTFSHYRVVYTFALKTTDINARHEIESNIDKLMNMGRYCLQNILQIVTLPNRHPHSFTKPELKLVINNQVPHENNT